MYGRCFQIKFIINNNNNLECISENVNNLTVVIVR